MKEKMVDKKFHLFGIALLAMVLLFGVIFVSNLNGDSVTGKVITGFATGCGGGTWSKVVCGDGTCVSNSESAVTCPQDCQRYAYDSNNGGQCIISSTGAYVGDSGLEKCRYDNCVDWSSSNPNCAAKGKDCPSGYDLNGDICCEKGTEPTSKLGYNICEGTKDYCQAQGMQYCSGGFPSYVDVCCPLDMICDKSSGIAYCANNNGNNCNTLAGETLCVDNLCCKSDEGCVESAGAGFCYPKTKDSCTSTQTFCSGSVDGIGEVNLCCDEGATCEHYLNGGPFCYKKS